jgi:hypothetical protein
MNNGELVATTHNDVLSAYHRCVPPQKLTWHIMLFLPARDAIAAAACKPVLISYNDDTAWWVQEVQPPVKAFPELVMPDTCRR